MAFDLSAYPQELWGSIAGAYNAYNTNNNVQNSLGSVAGANNVASLQQQIQAARDAAMQQYTAAQGNVAAQNARLGQEADSLSSQLSALSDPNSAYMQNARQAIERKDAAAGRRSQWGDREVQLAGTLADYVGKYAPGLQNSITNARQQISQNDQGLASLFSNANQVADRSQQSLAQMLQQQLALAAAQNTTGRQAGNSLINNLGGAIKGLGGLFSGSTSGDGATGIMDYYNPSLSGGITGYSPDFGGGYDLGSGYGSWDTGGGYYGSLLGGGDIWGTGGGFDYGSGGILDNSLW